MRVLVCGGRDFEDRELVFMALDYVKPTLIIEGGQRTHRGEEIIGGADYWAMKWAQERGIECRTVNAKWYDLETPPVVIKKSPKNGREYNAAAGGIRNQRMLDEEKPDLVVGMAGGSGTRDMIERARKAGVPVKLINWQG